jgi:hypothetical protein
MFVPARRRFRVAIVLVASLLFQQVAVAAHACDREFAPPVMPPGMEHCAGMAMAPAIAPAASPSLQLCEKHCVPDLSVTSDASALAVPVMALPPAFFPVLAQPASQATLRLQVPIARSDPPPRLRYCSLLI